jgi:polyisoprenoid-binding protein YceI
MLALAVAVVLASGVAGGAPSTATWEVDGAHSAATFAVKHMMVAEVVGKLGPVKGTLRLDDKNITRSSVSARIDVAGIETGNSKRDAHLRSSDFFDVEKYPNVTFESTSVEGADHGRLRVTGVLEMHGVRKSITLDAQLTDEVVNPITNEASRGVSAKVAIKRSDFGLTWQMPMENNGVLVGEEVQVTIDLHVVKRGPNE